MAWRCNLGFPDFALPLERGLVTLERGIRASSIFSALFYGPLERRHVSHDRAGVERPSSGDFTHPVLLQYARAGKLTLERVPYCMSARAGKTALERVSVFSETSKTAF